MKPKIITSEDVKLAQDAEAFYVHNELIWNPLDKATGKRPYIGICVTDEDGYEHTAVAPSEEFSERATSLAEALVYVAELWEQGVFSKER